MTNVVALTDISNRLADRYGARGIVAANRLQTWLEGAVPMGFPHALARHLEEQHVPLLFDAFWQVLPFGTGGRRGRVGYGSNRFNHSTAAMTVQGHCNYLAAAFPGTKSPSSSPMTFECSSISPAFTVSWEVSTPY